MAKLDLFNIAKTKVGSIELNDEVFGVKVNHALVHQVIKAQLADRRQGTAKTKVKSEVRGGGKKPFRQKGTGNARQGSTRSPLMVGGGQNFGPIPRSYAQATPKEMVKGALRSALSDRVASKKALFLDSFEMPGTKTKQFVEIQKKFGWDKVLIIDELNEKLERSSRNVPRIRVLRTEGLNVYDIVKYEWIVLTQRAVEKIQSRLG